MTDPVVIPMASRYVLQAVLYQHILTLSSHRRHLLATITTMTGPLRRRRLLLPPQVVHLRPLLVVTPMAVPLRLGRR